jgi:hypothetical protein
MRSVRRLLVAFAAILSLTALAPAVSAAHQTDFLLQKTCDGLTCQVTDSSFKGIPDGTFIHYTELDGGLLRSVISVPHGSATGLCDLSPLFGDPAQPGRCVFATGTGRLTRFHLDVAVTTTDGVHWTWEGTSWFGGR